MQRKCSSPVLYVVLNASNKPGAPMAEFRSSPQLPFNGPQLQRQYTPVSQQVAGSREASDSSHCWQCVESRSQSAPSCRRNHSTVAVPQAHLLPQRE
jgi:hypothetical protein